MWELEFCADWKIEVWSASVYKVNLYVCVCLYKSSVYRWVFMCLQHVAAHRIWPWHPASASIYPKTYSVIWSCENKWGVIHKVGETVLFTFQRENGVCEILKSIGWLFQDICRYIFILMLSSFMCMGQLISLESWQNFPLIWRSCVPLIFHSWAVYATGSQNGGYY